MCLFVPHYASTLVLSTTAYALCLFVFYYDSTLVLCTEAYAVCLCFPRNVSTLAISKDVYDMFYAICLVRLSPHYVSTLVLSSAAHAVSV